MSKHEHKSANALTGNSAAHRSTDTPANLFAACCALLASGDPRANRLLPELERFPRFFEGWTDLGDTLLQLDQLSAARVAFDHALAVRPLGTRAVLGKAEILRRQDQPAEAVDWVLASAPDWWRSAPLVHIVGRCRYASGDWLGAEQTLAQAVSLDASLAHGWFRLGRVREDLHRWPAAIEAYIHALAAQPTLFEAALNLGICYQEAGQLDAAMQSYAVAVRSQPACFNRVAQALTSASTGRLWLDLEALRTHLSAML